MTFACSSAVSYVSTSTTVHSIDLTSSISASSVGSSRALAKSGSGPLTDDGRLSSARSIVRSAVTMATRGTSSPCSRARCSAVRRSVGSAESAREVRKSA